MVNQLRRCDWITWTFIAVASGILHEDGVSVKKSGRGGERQQRQSVPHPQPELGHAKIRRHRLQRLLHRAFIQRTYLLSNST